MHHTGGHQIPVYYEMINAAEALSAMAFFERYLNPSRRASEAGTGY